ncbi:hypothetical protein G6F43_009805 [Rhizopus delemar]|nr:hypothetical protein G6F43_009805 [Rhizopus delemar]
MPPDSTKPDNHGNMYNILSQDEIDHLIFKTHRKYLTWPNCEKKGYFSPHRSEPPQPIFRCTDCSSSFRAKTMLSIVHSMQPTPVNTQTSVDSEFFQGVMSSQVTRTDNSQNDSQSLLNMIQLQTKELAFTRTEIERLRVQTTHLQQNNTSNPTNPLNPFEFSSSSEHPNNTFTIIFMAPT